MVRRSVVLAPLLLALTALQAQAEQSQLNAKEALQSLLSNALQVTIAARMLPSEEKPIWKAQSTQITLPGRSIRVRLDGDNIRIYLICTPYVQDNKGVLLLAQGQVWFAEPTDNEVKYSSTFSSIPISFGEKVLFFPLGFTGEQAQRKGVASVQVEVEIVPYRPQPLSQPSVQHLQPQQ